MLIEVCDPGQVNLWVKPPLTSFGMSNLSIWPAILLDLFNYAT